MFASYSSHVCAKRESNQIDITQWCYFIVHHKINEASNIGSDWFNAIAGSNIVQSVRWSLPIHGYQVDIFFRPFQISYGKWQIYFQLKSIRDVFNDVFNDNTLNSLCPYRLTFWIFGRRCENLFWKAREWFLIYSYSFYCFKV